MGCRYARGRHDRVSRQKVRTSCQQAEEQPMERKLVTIQSIDALDPITGADNVVRARVMGWNVVVKKDEFSVGDPCVFFEIDSVLPNGPSWSEFMRPRGFRVRTIKLRGVLSQGLALPVSIVEGAPPLREVNLCARLGVTKFE